MSKNPPDPTKVLLQPNFGRKRGVEETQNTKQERFVPPAAELNIVVDIDYLLPYDKNPRRSVNPRYDDIKESIRRVGLEQPFSITHRPEDGDKYIIRSGGNTRLQILKELYQETGDEKFKKVQARFIPYTDELDLLSLHMVENELRGNMLFIDTALAVFNFKEMFESDHNTLSQRELVDEMQKRGWNVKQPHITSYLYAANEINEYLPNAFESGLGRTNVDRIRKLDNYLETWAEERNYDPHRVNRIFKNVLRENDAPALNLEIIEEYVINRLASEFRLNTRDVKNSLNLLKSGHSLIDYTEAEEKGDYTPLPVSVPSSIDTPRLSEVSHKPVPFTGSFPSSYPSSVEQDLLLESPQDEVSTRSHHQTIIKDLLNTIIASLNFEEVFSENDHATLFDIQILPNQLVSEGGKLAEEVFPIDKAGIYYGIYTRLRLIQLAVEFKSNPTRYRNEIRRMCDANHLGFNGDVASIVPYQLISNTSILLPEYFQTQLINFVNIEVKEAFSLLPVLDSHIHHYLSTFIDD